MEDSNPFNIENLCERKFAGRSNPVLAPSMLGLPENDSERFLSTHEGVESFWSPTDAESHIDSGFEPLLETDFVCKNGTAGERDLATQELAQHFATQVRALERLLGEKDALLQRRAIEIESLQSRIRALLDQVAHLEFVLAQEARSDSEGGETRLEATAKDREERAYAKRERHESSAAKARDLEKQLRAKDGLLESRDIELKHTQGLIFDLVEDNVKLRERMPVEVQRLTSALREKKIALASYEKSHWRSIGRRNFLKRMLRQKSLKGWLNILHLIVR